MRMTASQSRENIASTIQIYLPIILAFIKDLVVVSGPISHLTLMDLLTLYTQSIIEVASWS